MDSAGIIPEEDLQEGGEEKPVESGEAEKEEPEAEGGEERLSIFEDFLENLDLEEGDDDEGEEKGKT
jgi:hypothetical protein